MFVLPPAVQPVPVPRVQAVLPVLFPSFIIFSFTLGFRTKCNNFHVMFFSFESVELI